jgi:lipopolysaccharide export system protein LptC
MRLPGSSTLFPLLVLAMLAAFTFWLDHANRSDDGGGNAKLRHDVDFWVDEFNLRRYNLDGSIQHTLKATRMEHFPDDETTEVTEPRIAYFRDQQATTMTSRSAWLDKEAKHVQLREDVRVIRTEADGKAMLIDTSVLDVTPDDEYAHTEAPVTITQGKSVIHGAGGLEVSNKTRTAVLRGPVTATIYPEHSR